MPLPTSNLYEYRKEHQVAAPDLPTWAGDVVRIRWQIDMADGSGTSLIHMDVAPPTTVPPSVSALQLSDIHTAVANAVTPSLCDNLTTQCNVLISWAESRRDAALVPNTQVHSSPGLLGGDTLPSFVQATMRFYTSTRGKKGYGKTQMPGVAESSVTDNELNATGFLRYEALATVMMGPFSTPLGDWRPCLSQRHSFNQSTGSWSLRMQLLTTIVPRVLVGTQRRRLTGRGI